MTLRHKLSGAALGVATTLFVLAGTAGAQTGDPVGGKINEVRDQFSGYSVILLGAVATIVGVFIAIPLLKKFARMVRNAIG